MSANRLKSLQICNRAGTSWAAVWYVRYRYAFPLDRRGGCFDRRRHSSCWMAASRVNHRLNRAGCCHHCCGTCRPAVADKWPTIARFMSDAATPSAWFMLLLLVAAFILFGPQFKQPRRQSLGKDASGLADGRKIETRFIELEERQSELAIKSQSVRS